ncbi:MAG: HAD family hydrolase [bacterium]
MDKLTPRAVLFDLGGTLIEYPSTMWDEISEQSIANAREYVLAQGFDLPDEPTFITLYREVRDGYRKTAAETLIEWSVDQLARRMLERSGLEPSPELVDGFFDAFYERVEPHIFVFEDTREVLGRLRQRYETIGLISNTIFPERVHRSELTKFRLADFFDFTVFSSTFGLRKPHADIFCHAANLAGCAPAECIYIGDRYIEDIEGPARVGMPAILRWHEGRDYPDDMPAARRQIKSLSGLAEHLVI